MATSSHREKELPKFPVKTARAAIVAMVIILGLATYLSAKIGDGLRDGMRSQIDVLTASERLEHYGSVLEISIRSVASYGDEAAAKRFRTVQPQLRATLAALRADLSVKEDSAIAKRVTQADVALTAIEHEALKQASEGDLEEARTLVDSPRYSQLVGVYTEGLNNIQERAAAHVAATDAKFDTYLIANLTITVLAFGLIVLGWIAVLRPARYWGIMVKDAHKQTEIASSLLATSEASLRSANVRLAEQVKIDHLTKLQTRSKLDRDLNEIWPRVDRYSERYCAIMCDIDYFKAYNDTNGHLEGDQVLRQVADALTSVCRGGDQIYRFGGEEFLILLSNCSIESGVTSAERYRAAVEALAIPHPKSPSGILTISMGVAAVEEGTGATIAGWLGAADAALYRAKDAGRNRVAGSPVVSV